MPTIGVAVPCYDRHIPAVKELLHTLEQQTRKPDDVVISCSSTSTNNFLDKTYSFPVRVMCTPVRKNAAENRNIAARALDTDIISFFDADDLMHPQRLEFVEKAFLAYPDTCLVVHNFSNRETPFQMYSDIRLHLNAIRPTPHNVWLSHATQPHLAIHHSQSSVPLRVARAIMHREQREYERAEDSWFCGDVLSKFGNTVYIEQPLSQYKPEGVWYS